MAGHGYEIVQEINIHLSSLQIISKFSICVTELSWSIYGDINLCKSSL